jgi:formylglycine-generating enzyme required for sulfatase activity
MVKVPAGTFLMGAPKEESQREGAPKDTWGRTEPRRAISVPTFALARFETSVAEFRAFVEATGHDGGRTCQGKNNAGTVVEQQNHNWDSPGYPGQTDRHPVVCVNWHDAKAYVRWLSATTGKTYRLPSEAEWEYAARAGTRTVRFWGDRPADACTFANVYDVRGHAALKWPAPHHMCEDGHAGAAPVGSFKPNAFGLHDMLGNVWEWVEDCWNESCAKLPLSAKPVQSGNCERRVQRGGSWDDAPRNARAAVRTRAETGVRYWHRGFRVARDLP